jgi:hypothetical protein
MNIPPSIWGLHKIVWQALYVLGIHCTIPSWCILIMLRFMRVRGPPGLYIRSHLCNTGKHSFIAVPNVHMSRKIDCLQAPFIFLTKIIEATPSARSLALAVHCSFSYPRSYTI